ncbi:MAG: hypothetical protein AABW58_04430 [Nanoarchaeota archaeon]
MLYPFHDNGRGILTLDTDHIDYDRLCDFLGIKNREKDRLAVKKIIESFESGNPDIVEAFLSREEIVTRGRLDFTFFAEGSVAGDSEGRLYFGENPFTNALNRLVEEGLLERKLKETKVLGKKVEKPVYGINPKKIYQLIQ